MRLKNNIARAMKKIYIAALYLRTAHPPYGHFSALSASSLFRMLHGKREYRRARNYARKVAAQELPGGRAPAERRKLGQKVGGRFLARARQRERAFSTNGKGRARFSGERRGARARVDPP